MTQDRGSRPNLSAPEPSLLLARIRNLAKDSKNVWFSTHAEDRMDERGISDLEILRGLRQGALKGSIEPGRSPDEWKCKVTAVVKGRREMGIVVLVVRDRRILIKTVEWEDLR